MKSLRYIYGLLIFVGTLLVSGCHLTITLNDHSPIGDDNTSVLPDPPGGDPQPPLNEAQQARADEAAWYTANVIYQGATISQAIQLPSGDVIDGLDRNTLPALPYPLPALPFGPDALQLPPGVDFGVPDFEQYPALADLVSTATPVERPDFTAYIMGETDATSIEDYLARYQVGGAPTASEHLYAGLRSPEPNRGVWGYMNQFHPEVEKDTFSLMEFAVGCPGPPAAAQEVIGVVISVDKLNAVGRGGQPRLHIEYAVPGPSGEAQYTWDNLDGMFHMSPGRRYRPGEIVDVSVLAGKQVEHLVGIFQEPIWGDWWIFYKDDLLGYFPADMWTMLHAGACQSAWYIEIAREKPLSSTPSPTTWPKTQGGSGQPASAGPLLAAYVRTPWFIDISYLLGVQPYDDFDTTLMKPYVKECYNREPLKDGYIFFGGEGGFNSNCKSPFPPGP